MTEEILRRVVREVVREELAPIKARLDALESRMDGLESRMDGLESRMDVLTAEVGRTTDVLRFLARCWPGTMPGHESHVSQEVERILSA
ncbi:MAG: hypothetical protein OXI71_14010 [Gemmatimonadota bacterium]|nr:hypothetical protein [Gemmatimonadota bacterium]